MKTIITYRYYGNKTKQIETVEWYNIDGKHYDCKLEDGTIISLAINKVEKMEVR